VNSASNSNALPPFTAYASLRGNILGENNQTLLGMPLFEGEDQELAETEINKTKIVDGGYVVLVEEERILYLDRLHRSNQYQSYVRRFLKELNIDQDRLARMIRDEPVVRDVLRIQKYLGEDRMKWGVKLKSVAEQLLDVKDPEIRKYGFSYVAVLKECEFGMQLMLPDPDRDQLAWQLIPAEEVTFREVACRVCHL
jgi:hypothetical protein